MVGPEFLGLLIVIFMNVGTEAVHPVDCFEGQQKKWKPSSFAMDAVMAVGNKFMEDGSCWSTKDEVRKNRINALWQKYVDAGKKPVFMDIDMEPSAPDPDLIKLADGYNYACLRVDYNLCHFNFQIVTRGKGRKRINVQKRSEASLTSLSSKGIDDLNFARADKAVENTTVVEDKSFSHRVAWTPPPPTDCWGGDEYATKLSKGVVKHVIDLYEIYDTKEMRDAVWKNFVNTGKKPIFVAFTDLSRHEIEAYTMKYANGLHFHCVHYIHDHVQILTKNK